MRAGRLAVALGLELALFPPPLAAEPAPAVPSAADVASQAAPLGAPARAHWDLWGAAREEYLYRRADSLGQSDQKLHLYLDLGARESGERFSATAALDLWWDLDGHPNGAPPVFASVYDGRNPWVNVLALSADWRPPGAVRLVRFGRQEAPFGRPGMFDGATVVVSPGRGEVDLFAFGGRNAYFFAVDVGTFDDWMGSLGASWRVSPRLRIEADWRILRGVVLKRTTEGTETVVDNSYGATAWWRPSDAVRVKLVARGIDALFEEVSAAANATLPWELGLDLALGFQPSTLRDLNEQDNPYYTTLGESLPFGRARVDLFRAFPSGIGTFQAHLGYQARWLLDHAETPFNRNLGRLYALAAASDLLLRGLYASVSFERVGGSPSLSPNAMWAVNGAVGFEPGALKAEVGTQYYRYYYSYYANADEIADVRAVYAEARFKVSTALSIRARWLTEVLDQTVQTFFVGLAQSWEGGTR